MDEKEIVNRDLEKKIERWKRTAEDKQRDINRSKERHLTHKRKSKITKK